ncbi:MAG: hypothetical protein C4288_08215 [Leptolyngbya sp. ERB_1_1]
MLSKQLQSSLNLTIRWEYLLTTTVLSICSAFLISSLAALRPERYHQLIVGSITWSAQSKQPDYIFLFSLVIVFFLLFLGLNKLGQTIQEINGEAAEFAFRSLLVYALLPCGIVIGRVLVELDDSVVEFLVASLLMCCFAIALAIRLAIRKLEDISHQEYIEAIGGSLLYVLFSLLMGSTLLFAIGRIYPAWQIQQSSQVEWISGVIAILLWLPLIRIWATRSLSLAVVRSKVRFLLWASQATFPLFFLVLLPDIAIAAQRRFYSFSFTWALPILIAVCTVVTCIDWFRRSRTLSQEETSVFSAISPIGLIGLLLYLKAPLQQLQAISQDDYHFGEFLTPWWIWRNFNAIPFWDYEPARGLINYLTGALGNIFYGDTAVAYQAVFGTNDGSAIWILPFLVISFVALYRTIGLLPAFLACLLMPMNTGLSEIDAVMVAALCVLGNAFFAKAWTRWLLIWSMTGIALILFAPAQAGLLMLSTLPIAGFALLQAIRKERKQLIRAFAIAIPIFLLVCWLTPIGKMLVGAVRYVREQSSINSVAHGIAWSDSRDIHPILSYSLWEILRVSWIPIGVFAGFLLLKALVDKTWAVRDRYIVFGIPILLLTVLLIPRALGRVDPNTLSRPGAASVMAICLFLPIVLFLAYGQRRMALSLFTVALLRGVLQGIPVPPPVPTPLFAKPSELVKAESLNVKDATQLGLPNLAQTLVDPTVFDRLAKIKPVLAAVIDPGETYLDLTNRNAQYFYLGYRLPIQAGAFYNLPHVNQQQRAIQRLEADPPPIVVAAAETLLPDQLPASLRSYLLYRFVVDRYIPVKINQFIYLVRPDRFSRLTAQLPQTNGKPATLSNLEAERLNLLDEVFQVKDLRSIPRAWGASFESLKPALRLVKEIPQSAIVGGKDTQPADGAYRVTGNDPFIVYDVGDLKLNGKAAGILVFDFSAFNRNKSSRLAVYWSSRSTGDQSEKTAVRFSARNGKAIVPLDTAPRWLLAEGIKTIRVDVDDLPPGSKFMVSNVALFQRSEVEKR